MESNKRGSRGFREGLRRELPAWVDQGVIDEEGATRLRTRYGLDDEEASIASAAVFTLAALLVGGGVISFFAWNWEFIPKAIKLLMIAAAVTSAHFFGWKLWRVTKSSPRLGHALVFLGTLLFGAGIGLVAQVFHLNSNPMDGVGAWAFGAVAVALIARSTPHAVLANLLAAMWVGWTITKHDQASWPLMTYLVHVALFVGLAWRAKSVVALIVAVASSTILTLMVFGDDGFGFSFLTLVAVAVILLAASAVVRLNTTEGRIASAFRWMGFSILVPMLYLASFREIAEEFRKLDFDVSASQAFVGLSPVVLIGTLVVAALIATKARPRNETLIAIGASVLLGLTVLFPAPETTVPLVVHIALAGLIVVWISEALSTLRRGRFWLGSILGVIIVYSRFLEFETNLLTKSIVFILSGLAMFGIGIVFERRLKSTKEVSHAA